MSSYKSTRPQQINNPKRTRQYSPSKNFIYTPLAVQQDQKQIIIAKLKQEIVLLQKNDSQLLVLKQHYKKLDQQFNLLLTQKKSNDQSFAKHHEAALKQICQIKNDIDTMKVDFRQKKLEIQDLNADQSTLKNQLDQKQIEIEKLKNQLRSSIVDNQQLTIQRQKLVEIHKNVSLQRQRRSQDCQKMKYDIEKTEKKIQELKNYQDSLLKQQRILTEQIMKFEEDNNKADQSISATCQDISIIDNKIQQSQRNIVDLQKKIAQTSTNSQKYKNEGLYHKKSTQAEVMKNNDITKDIQQAEVLSQVRANQIKEGKRQLQLLTEQNISLQKVNEQLQDDLQACKKHLQNLSLLNSQLVQHMNSISQQDQQVRNLIDRKNRVQRASQMVRNMQISKKDYNLSDTREQSFRQSSSLRSKTRRSYY